MTMSTSSVSTRLWHTFHFALLISPTPGNGHQRRSRTAIPGRTNVLVRGRLSFVCSVLCIPALRADALCVPRGGKGRTAAVAIPYAEATAATVQRGWRRGMGPRFPMLAVLHGNTRPRGYAWARTEQTARA